MIKEASKTKAGSKHITQAALLYHIPTCLICFLLALLISGASFHGQSFIGGVSFVGALGAGIHAAFALIGIFIGYPLMFGFENTVHYLAGGLFIYTIAYICQYIRFYRSRAFMPLVVMSITALIRAFGNVNVIRPIGSELPELMIELLMGGSLTDLYGIVMKNDFNHNDPWSQYSLCAIFATILMSLSRVHIAGFISVSSMIAAAAYLTFIYKLPEQTSFPVGIMFGFALQHSGTIEDNILMHYILSSLSDVLPIKGSKARISLYYFGVSIAVFLMFGPAEEILIQLLESIIGMLLFIIFAKKSPKATTPVSHESTKPRKTKTEQLTAAAELLCRIADSTEGNIPDPTVQDPGLSEVFDRAADMVCGHCGNRSICWKAHIFDMVTVLEETTPCILKRGKLLEEDLPDYFTSRCPYAHSLVLAVNYELLRVYEEYDHAYDKLLLTYALNRQLHCCSDIIENLALQENTVPADEMRGSSYLQGEIGAASMKKSGEQVCGDSVRYFKTEDEMLYLILSDGIGTGKDAQQKSDLVVSVLEESIRLLHDPVLAIDLVNIALSAQPNANWEYATIDIAAVDMNSGEISFYKMGAADSYIITEQDTIIVQGNVVSAGGDDYTQQTTDVYRQFISPGSVVVMASDGVSITDVSSLSQQLQSHRGKMKSAAKKLLLAWSDDMDDRTVLLLSLTER